MIFAFTVLFSSPSFKETDICGGLVLLQIVAEVSYGWFTSSVIKPRPVRSFPRVTYPLQCLYETFKSPLHEAPTHLQRVRGDRDDSSLSRRSMTLLQRIPSSLTTPMWIWKTVATTRRLKHKPLAFVTLILKWHH